MMLYKSRSGDVFARLATVEYIRRAKEPKDLVLYAELEGGWHLALARFFARWLMPFNLKARSTSDFKDCFERLPEIKDDVDEGATATLRTWEAIQTELSGGSTPLPEVHQQPPAASHQTMVKESFLSMLRGSGMLVSIRPPDKWGKDGPKVREVFPSTYTIVDVQADDETMLWCFSASGKLLGVRPAEPLTDLQVFQRRFAPPGGVTRLTRHGQRLGEEFLERWPTASVTLIGVGKKDLWIFDDDEKFLGVE